MRRVPSGSPALAAVQPRPDARATYPQCDVMIEEEVPLFVCAVGVPPLFVVEKLHAAGIIVMNMIGKPRHAEKALAVGCDIICAQGTEGGGHTGEIATLPLIPQICDAVAGHTNFFGTPVPVIAAGGIFDGRGVAACMMLGASGVWCGTRFLVANEANVDDKYKQIVINSKSEDTTRIEIFSGRPMRVVRAPPSVQPNPSSAIHGVGGCLFRSAQTTRTTGRLLRR